MFDLIKLLIYENKSNIIKNYIKFDTLNIIKTHIVLVLKERKSILKKSFKTEFLTDFKSFKKNYLKLYNEYINVYDNGIIFIIKWELNIIILTDNDNIIYRFINYIDELLVRYKKFLHKIFNLNKFINKIIRFFGYNYNCNNIIYYNMYNHYRKDNKIDLFKLKNRSIIKYIKLYSLNEYFHLLNLKTDNSKNNKINYIKKKIIKIKKYLYEKWNKLWK